MVAIFTGLGAGFEQSSVAQIGAGGLLGSGAQGRGGDSVSINAATGNLLINRQDEFLIGRGPDVGISRTYNSLGALDENGDHWRQSTDRRVHSAGAAQNVNGATVTRVSADGSEIVYTYKTIDGVAAYWTDEGSGAHDKMTYSAGTWTWTDGDSQVVEKYQAVAGVSDWRLKSVTDRDGNQISYEYHSDGRLRNLKTADGSEVHYSYGGPGQNIQSIITKVGNDTDGFQFHTSTYYEYDTSNRLIKVTTDLTPEDNTVQTTGSGAALAGVQGESYVTTYSYHGSTDLVASITQTDGSRVDFTYDSSGRVYDIIQHAGANEPNRITKVRYENGYTDIYDPSGTRSILYHNGKGELTRSRIVVPNDDTDHSNYFTYDSSGNVKTVKDAEGNITTFYYDSRGNVTQTNDGLGSITNHQYNTNNQIIRTHTRASAEHTADSWLISHAAYDTEGHLRFNIDASGNVTEYTYDASGNLRVQYEYTDDKYPHTWTTPTETEMVAWRNGLADRSHTAIYENRYDARGNIIETVNWSSATATAGITFGDGFTHTFYTYDSDGRVLTQRIAGQAEQSFTYDGLGRQIRTTDLNGGTTSIVFKDAATQTVVTSAGGHVTTSTYNKAGNLISQTGSGSYDRTGTSTYQYDKNGRLRIVKDATGKKTYYIYDKIGNLTAEVDGAGQVQEFRYDDSGRQIASARHTYYKAHESTAARDAIITALSDPNNSLTIDDVKYSINGVAAHHPYDIWQFTAYDAKGQVSRTVLGDGSVTAYTYDNAGNLVKTHRYFNKLNAAQLANLRSGASADAYLPTANTVKDQVNRTFYDRSGRIIGTLNGDGYLTKNTYDGAGRLIQESAYASLTAANLRASGTYNQLYNALTKSTSQDAHVRYVYDGQGHLRFTIDALGKVTENVYNVHEVGGKNTAYVQRATIEHYATLSVGDYKYNTVKAAVAALGSKNLNRTSGAVYNNKDQLVYTIDPAGSVNHLTYDVSGNVIKATQFAFPLEDLATSLLTEEQMDTWAASNSTDARVTRQYYSAGGVLRFTIDAEGYVTQFNYDNENRLVSESRFSTAVAATDNWTKGTVQAQNKGTFAETRYSYDHQGRISSVYDPNGTRNFTHYYANGEVAWDIRAYGQGADESRVLHINDAAGRRTRTRQYQGSFADSSDPNYRDFRQTIYSYDGLGNLTRQLEDSGTHADGGVDYHTDFEYDKSGNVTKQTNAEGGVTLFEYNAFGQVTKTTDPNGNVTTNEYNRAGRLRYSYDEHKNQTQYSYNAFGEISSISFWKHSFNEDEGGDFYEDKLSQTNFIYDNLGRLLESHEYYNIEERDYYTEAYEYDAFGQQIKVTNKAGGITHYSYDDRGLLTQSRVVADVYNSSGTKTATQIKTTYGYDSRGNQTTVTEADGLSEARTTTYVYDSADQLIQKIGESVGFYSSGTDNSVRNDNPTETYVYDRRGNMIESIDATGGRTLYYYDKMDRVTHQISPEGTLVRNWYDANSNLIRTRVYEDKVDLSADFIQYVNGQAGLLNFYNTNVASTGQTKADWGKGHWLNDGVFEGRTLPNSLAGTPPSGGSAYRETEFTYDGVNRMVLSEVNHVQTARFDGALSLSEGSLETRYEYDANGNVVKVIDPNGGETFSYYDAFNRKTVQIDAEGYRTQWNYDANGNVTRERLYVTKTTGTINTATPPSYTNAWYDGDRVTDYTYDLNGRRLTETRHQVDVHNDSGEQVRKSSRIAYTYNALGQVTKKTEATGDFITYTYDAQGRLSKETRSGYVDHLGGAAVSPEVQYFYNGNGDLAQTLNVGKNGSISDAYTENYYDATGRLVSKTDAEGYVRHYAYDAKGQLVRETYVRDGNDEGIGYEYDLEGRVISQGAIKKVGNNWVRTDLTEVETRYNAFGDVSARGVNGVFAETFDYDNAGRVWRSTAGDGTYKYFFYDKNGNQTVSVTSDGLNIDNKSIDQIIDLWDTSGNPDFNRLATKGIDGVNVSITKYDARNLAVEVIEPSRELSGNLITNPTGDGGNRLVNNLPSGWTQWSNDSNGNYRFGVNGLAGSFWHLDGDDGTFEIHQQDNEVGKIYDLRTVFDFTAGEEYTASIYAGAHRANSEIFIHFSGNGQAQSFTSPETARIAAGEKAGGSDLSGYKYLTVTAEAPAWATKAYVIIRKQGTRAGSNDSWLFLTKPELHQTETLSTTRSYNAFGDVVSETDAAGNTIDYTYNTMGRRIKVESPEVSITHDDGTSELVRPTEHYYYDESGRLVASRDANQNLTRQELLSGTGYNGSQALTTKTIAADGGTVTTGYDIHGNAREITSQLGHSGGGVANEALGYTTYQSFDRLGRVEKVQHAGGLVDEFRYDMLGQKIEQWNNVGGYENSYFASTGNWVAGGLTSGANLKAETEYDAEGRVTLQVARGGDETAYDYTWLGTLSTAGLGTFGGWDVETTYANTKTLTVKSDVFGRQTYKNDLGSNVSNFTYNKGGQLASATGVESASYVYLNTGKLQTLTRGNTSGHYEYDKVGNLISEVQNLGNVVQKDSTATYDALGRLTSWSQAGSTSATASTYIAAAASVNYKYDANGNVRATEKTRAITLDNGGATAAVPEEHWFTYDSVNRVLINKGTLTGGSIQRGDDGIQIAYDKAGQRAYTLQNFADSHSYTGYRLEFGSGEPREVAYNATYDFTNTRKETYNYTAAGHLDTIHIAQGHITQTGGNTAYVPPNFTYHGPSGIGTKRSDFNYDFLGQITRQWDFDESGNEVFDRAVTYNGKGQIINDNSTTVRENETKITNSFFFYRGENVILGSSPRVDINSGTDAEYALGATTLAWTFNHTIENGSQTDHNPSETNYTYKWFDGAKADVTTHYQDVHKRETIYFDRTTHSYNSNGHLTSAHIADGQSRIVTYTNDLSGQVLRRQVEGQNVQDPLEVWYRYGGREMGFVGDNGTLNVNADKAIEQRTAEPGTGIFRNGAASGTNHIDFDQNYTALSSYNPGSASGGYTVRGGDTLQGIASGLYGDSSLWYKIAQANGLSGDTPLIEGTTLRLPAGVTRTTYNASTFNPYDPGAAIGDTAPTAPEPPKNGEAGCGVIGKILITVVAVAVTAIVAPYATAALGSVLGGAAAGAAGSIASQSFGVATGIQDKFSFKNVALAAIGGGVGGAFKDIEALGDLSNAAGKALNKATGLGANFSAGFAQGVTSSLLTQGIGVATGLQSSFSWAGVAAAGLGGGVDAGFNARYGGSISNAFKDGRAGDIASNVAGSTASSIANAATRSAIEGSNFGDNIIASIPDIIGGAVGNSIASDILALLPSPAAQTKANPSKTTASSDSGGGLGTLIRGLSGALNFATQKFNSAYNELIGNLSDAKSETHLAYLSARTQSSGVLGSDVITTAQRYNNRAVALHAQAAQSFARSHAASNERAAYVQGRFNLGARAGGSFVLPHSTGHWDFSNGISLVPLTDAEIRGRGGITQGDALRGLGGLGIRNSIELSQAAINEGLETAEFFVDGAARQALGPVFGTAAANAIDTSGLQFQDVNPHATYAVRAGSTLFGGPAGIVGNIRHARHVDELVISTKALGNPEAIVKGVGSLNSRQLSTLESLPGFGNQTIVHKSFSNNDLAALTASTGDEFAMFTTGGRRLIVRGDNTSVPITPAKAANLASKGWRWSSHTHPGTTSNVLRSSPGDRAVLLATGGNRSSIYNSSGDWRIFTRNGDDFSKWVP